MTVKIRADLLADIATYLATNGVGAISAEDLRDQLVNIVDSAQLAEDPVGGGEAVCQGRLTLESGVPVSITDQTAKTSIIWTPYRGNKIGLYSGGEWLVLSFAELSLTLAPLGIGITTGKPYDVFGYVSSGAVAIEYLVWTDDITRATAIALQDGIPVKSGDATRRYLGTFYTSAAGQCEDSLAKRFVWNLYNRIRRPMKVVEATNTWTYNSATIRQANAAAANKLEFVQGLAEEEVHANLVAIASPNSATAPKPGVGIGLDRTTGFDGIFVTYAANLAGDYTQLVAQYRGVPAAGRHYLSWNESFATSGGNGKFYGDDGVTTLQAGLNGSIAG